MGRKRYGDDFKIEAVRQVTVGGDSVPKVAERLGVTTNSLYKWIRILGESPERSAQIRADEAVNQCNRRENHAPSHVVTAEGCMHIRLPIVVAGSQTRFSCCCEVSWTGRVSVLGAIIEWTLPHRQRLG